MLFNNLVHQIGEGTVTHVRETYTMPSLITLARIKLPPKTAYVMLQRNDNTGYYYCAVNDDTMSGLKLAINSGFFPYQTIGQDSAWVEKANGEWYICTQRQTTGNYFTLDHNLLYGYIE